MIINRTRFTSLAALLAVACASLSVLHGIASAQSPGQPAGPSGESPVLQSPPFIFHVGGNERLEMTVKTSRLLTLTEKIPQVQVHDPDIIEVTPMSPSQVQISAKRTGVTQVNLWTDTKQIRTIDVVVMGDVRELENILRLKFPKTNLQITPIGNAVMLQGFVDQQDAVPRIVMIAEQYFPRVINAMVVSGVQQTNLHVKVIEVSRTKLRNMGFDFLHTNGGNMFMSGISGLLNTASGAPFGGPGAAPDNTIKFSVLPNGGATAFYGVFEALRQDNLGKILSEPDLVAISGRPAYILVGGEVGYQTTSGLTGPVVGFKEYGTRLDFVPIVLGNARIHLDVKSRVSQIDGANSVGGIPALKTREVETGVEMRSGQTFAIAGIVEQREEASNQGVPWISEVPYLGALFRAVHHSVNEVELLVLITPEIVDPMDPAQVPVCLPGSSTTKPGDWDLFMRGHLEVPNCCPDNGACAACPAGAAGPGQAPHTAADAPQKPNDPLKPNEVAQNSLPEEPGFIGPIGYEYLK